MQNSLAKAGMLRVAATYATFERRALLRQATAKPPMRRMWWWIPSPQA